MDGLFLIGSAVLATILILIFRRFRTEETETPDESDPRQRRLGGMEHLMALAHEDGNLLVACSISIVAKFPLHENIPLLREALARIMQRHPLLGARIVWKTRNKKVVPYFVLNDDHLDVPFRVSDSSSWLKEYEDQLLIKYNEETGPLWRAVYLPNVPPSHTDVKYPHEARLVFGFHHSIADGFTCMRFFNELLVELENITLKATEPIEILPLPPAVDVYIKELIHPSKLLRLFTCLLSFPASRAVLSWLMKTFPPKNRWIEKFGKEIERDPLCEKKTSIITMEFSVEETEDLLTSCKRHHVTVQGAIQAACSIAIATMYSGGDLPRDTAIKLGVTGDLRGIHSEVIKTPYCFASYVTVIMKEARVTSTSRSGFWEFAKSNTESIHRNLKETSVDFIRLLSVVTSPGYVKLLSSNPTLKDARFDNILSLNNFGNCNFLTRTDQNLVRLRAANIGTAEHATGPIFATTYVTFERQLYWTFSYFTNITTREVAEQYKSLCREILIEATTFNSNC